MPVLSRNTSHSRLYTLDYQCITQNPHFSTIYLDTEVLEVALLAMADVRVETLLQPIASW